MKKILILPVLLVLLNMHPAYSQQEAQGRNDFIAGFKGGYSFIQGHYISQIRNSGVFGGWFMIALPGIYRYLMLETGFAYSNYVLVNNTGSNMRSWSIDAGPVFYYPASSHLRPYAGVSVKGDFLFLKGSGYYSDSSAFKPGIVIKSGIFIPLLWGIDSRLGVEYGLTYLSGKPFMELKTCAGISFNYNAFSRSADVEAISDNTGSAKIERLYLLGIKEYDAGRPGKAAEYLGRVYSMNRTYRDVNKYLESIKADEKDFTDALLLVSDKKYYEAIQLFERSSLHRQDAAEKLVKLREQLAGEVPLLEKQGIEAYDRQDYGACIMLMNRIRLIDPLNRVYQLYLPRAVKRYEALKKLQGGG